MSFQLYFTITTESGLNSLKVIFTKQFLTKVTIFCCFDVCSVQPPQIFHIQAKISTVQPVFPGYLSISYDCLDRTASCISFQTSVRHLLRLVKTNLLETASL